jgi:hypothetical protein
LQLDAHEMVASRRVLEFSGAGRSIVRYRASADARRPWDESVRLLLRKTAPSFIQILATRFGTVSEGERGSKGLVIGRERAIGSDFVMDSAGYILSNALVVNGLMRM